MTPNEAAVKVAAMMEKGSKFESDVWMAWGRVCDKIEARALAARPKPKSYEVHHESQVARLAFLTAIADNDPISTAENIALERVGL